MLKTVRVFLSETHDPWFNLATENWIFHHLDPQIPTLFLWRNQETVIIGRFQNPWLECNNILMEEDGVLLARRQSGGGAVFQDLGNTNFTFLNHKESFSKERNSQIILNALKKYNIRAQVHGRNDLVIETGEGLKKISGSAYKETLNSALHHGTLLINADLHKLERYLNPDPKKLAAKGVSSVRARVANLMQFSASIDHAKLTQSIVEEFAAAYQADCTVELLKVDHLQEIELLRSYYTQFKDWNWRYGRTPPFTHVMDERFSWGGMHVQLNAQDGLIKQTTIYSDCLFPDLVETLMQMYVDIPYSLDGASMVESKLYQRFEKSTPEYLPIIRDFSQWMRAQLQ